MSSALRAAALAAALTTVCLCQPARAQAPAQVFFDDFSYRHSGELGSGGWTPRSQTGHPGIPGAQWRSDALSLLDDAELKGNRLLRLRAATDGTGQGTQQVQLCHARKYLEGTYAARLRFRDAPSSGADGDPVIQTFYVVSPLKHDFDPEFSEIDWEYLPNGGWGSPDTRIYGISWQTVKLEPWQAFNGSHQERGSLNGWHTLMMQVLDGEVRLFIDGRQVATHGGRNYPVVPMSINFNLWFSPGGLLPASATPRVYEQDVDWVFHARNARLSPAEVAAQVAALRQAGSARVDQVPPAQPPLDSRCDF
ncbi:glycoside hydrolase family 16 protein [Paucibacter sp. XJ19-41]|uniref:glycoside hydrolase family 16 protein n=1 Tax=Paucibacter sp. XJ19-41 TaxID=2927824 RepID=UPI00234978AB|nr:glycoside hydrolase family 16 protein [Paucibacter sp. XJ19-41]MDC6168302.1 glycoside hydrolase family 16 protein [Paucibacter sp. XJ19-41]